MDATQIAADHEQIARDHFEAIEHEGGLVAYYWIDFHLFFLIARPPHGSGHRLSCTCSLHELESKMMGYIRSVGRNFSYADLLIKEFELLDGEVT